MITFLAAAVMLVLELLPENNIFFQHFQEFKKYEKID